MKSVAKAATPKQLNLDFEGCAPMPVRLGQKRHGSGRHRRALTSQRSRKPDGSGGHRVLVSRRTGPRSSWPACVERLPPALAEIGKPAIYRTGFEIVELPTL